MRTWTTGRPHRFGWYNAVTDGVHDPMIRRYWNGEWWSVPILAGYPADRFERAKVCKGESQAPDIEWRFARSVPGRVLGVWQHGAPRRAGWYLASTPDAPCKQEARFYGRRGWSVPGDACRRGAAQDITFCGLARGGRFSPRLSVGSRWKLVSIATPRVKQAPTRVVAPVKS